MEQSDKAGKTMTEKMEDMEGQCETFNVCTMGVSEGEKQRR